MAAIDATVSELGVRSDGITLVDKFDKGEALGSPPWGGQITTHQRAVALALPGEIARRGCL
jgi:hypothetical protein